MFKSIKKSSAGFTLIELAVVVTIMGIMTGSAILLLSSLGKRDAVNAADVLRRDLVHLQALALNNGVPLRLTIMPITKNVCSDSGGITTCTTVLDYAHYMATCLVAASGTPCTAAGAVFVDPLSNERFDVRVTDGIQLTAVDSASVAATTLDFDSVGRPISGNALIATNPARVFTLAVAATSTAPAKAPVNVLVRPITGFAEVSF